MAAKGVGAGVSKCRSCGAEVFWARNRTTGRTAPIDIEETPDGNIVVFEDGTYAVVVNSGNRINHFVTCPNREEHRKEH